MAKKEKEKKSAEELKVLIAEQEQVRKALKKKIDKLKKDKGITALTGELQKIEYNLGKFRFEWESIEEEDVTQESIRQLLGGEENLTNKWLRAPKSNDCDYLYVFKQDGENCDCLTINLDKVDDSEPEVYKEDGQFKVGTKGQTTIETDRPSLGINWIAEEGFKIVSPLEIVVSLFAPEALIEAVKKCKSDEVTLIVANNKLHRVIGSVSIY